MAKQKGAGDRFDDATASKRFEAAIRGARIAGHKPLESVTRRTVKKQRRVVKKSKVSA
jgi:hypothetical protein